MLIKKIRKSENSATIRMFCHGLGDCFLISFPQKSSRDYHILIDCGIAMGTSNEDLVMQQVVEQIAALTHDPDKNKPVIDLLVVTHEHRDHVSGFIQAEDEFKKFEVKNIWFGWTESRRDPLANALRTKHAREKAALAQVVKTAEKTAPLGKHQLTALNGVLAFYSPASSGRKSVDVSEAMEIVASLKKQGTPEFLVPGTLKSLPDAPNGTIAADTKAYVLGPPHDETILRRINPRKNTDEVYHKKKHPSVGMSWAWVAAMSNHAVALGLCDHSETDSACERAMPFDVKWRKPIKKLQNEKKHSFFQRHYYHDDEQRRIDGDWLWSGAQQLALYMESYTNNTSLVLAFELPATKKVLLFVGDAQVGNWLSWHDLEFKPDDKRAVKATDLLANTVLYKVGHHGSHNATLREKGLELMNHPELVAMIPVEIDAVKRLGYGEMPLQSLVKELNKRTSARVLQLDKKWSSGKSPGTWDGLERARVSKECFKGGASGRPLYIEYTVSDKL